MIKKINYIIYLFLILIVSAAAPVLASDEIGNNLFKFQDLQHKTSIDGKVRVIVKLAVQDIHQLQARSRQFTSPAPGLARTWGGTSADQALSDQISYTAELVQMGLKGTGYRIFHVYKSIPYIAMEVTPEALAVLELTPEVLDIEEDMLMPLPDPVEPATPAGLDQPLLNNTVNITGASNAWSMGYTGAGWYVAVIDSGIRKTHEMFAGKTIVEACYAKGEISTDDPVGDCPNGLTSMIGPGAAVHYTSDYTGYDHGTHVAGIATGKGPTISGVAKDANIIAVKVFSKIPSTKKISGWNSDNLAGLDYVYSIRGSYSIAAVNMSLGGSQYNTPCDSDSRKAAIDNLRAAGIASAIATGNNYWCGSIGAPACISSSVAVGASTDSDVEADFSNWHPTMQKLFAPGVSVNSSTGDSDNSYEEWDGTSMATPHVAGAWALIKQAIPGGSVTDILAALQNTGVSINTTCPNPTGSLPRIQIDAAINLLITPNDFDSDGKIDILWRNTSSGLNLIWQMNGTEPTGTTWWLTTVDPSWQVQSTADFDNDGNPDILWRNTSSGQNLIWQMNGTAPTGSLWWLPTVNTFWQIQGTADFDNDGNPDILWRNTSSGQNLIWQMNGTAPTGSLWWLPTVNTFWQIQGTADFDNDGNPDILWRKTDIGYNLIWQMNGAEPTGTVWWLTTVDPSWQVQSTADFDNDGNPDILWRDTTSGLNIIWQMNGAEPSGTVWWLPTVDNAWMIVNE